MMGTRALPRAAKGAAGAPEVAAGGAARKIPAPISTASAASGRAPLAQFPETERADQRDNAADHPRQQHESRRPQPLGDGGGSAKDPATDDPADHCHRPGKKPETTRVACYFRDASNPA